MRWGYGRVSTLEQEHGLAGQIAELEKEGISPEYIRTEKISGSVPAQKRPVLSALLKEMVKGDTLVVTKLDRLGRNAPDTLGLLQKLDSEGIGVRILQLGADTTGSAGKLIIGVLAAVAEWERSALQERTRAGLDAARKAGILLGRRKALTKHQRVDAIAKISTGVSITDIARLHKVSRQTVYRLKWEIENSSVAQKDGLFC